MLEIILKRGNNKQISWIPGKDSVFLNEMVFVEVKLRNMSNLSTKAQ